MKSKAKWQSILFIGLVLLLPSLVVACKPSAPPVIVDFRAAPTQINVGESATLLWNVTQATTVSIDHGIGNVLAIGTKEVSPAITTAYTLTATNASGTLTKPVVVTVSTVSPPPTQPAPAREITLADAPAILDMSSDLPARFDHVDAASEGMSNKDLELGPEFSEVELFLSDEPFQMVFAYMTVVESRIERASFDALIRDEEQLKSNIIYWLEVGFVEEGMELPDVDLHATYPDIGELAALASGQMTTYGVPMGVDLLMFKNGEVYVAICQFYYESGLSTVPLAEGTNQRIEALTKK